MPKNRGYSKKSQTDNELLTELLEHYETAGQDNDKRQSRQNGWDDVLREYHGQLPSNWPYLSQITEPVIRTVLQEKNARLFNSKLRGRLVPREGGDVVKARIHNAVLDYQWDRANLGGSMIEKWALMDMQTRLFGASFGLVNWHIEEQNGKILYEGNEFEVLDNRDVFVDYTANHIKNANWVQIRRFQTLEDLKKLNKLSPEPMFNNLSELQNATQNQFSDGLRRSTLYQSPVKQMRGLEDRVGSDRSFPTLEIVTEYRKDRWITFSPTYSIILRDIKNPFDHQQLPVVMLRYYPVGDDIYGESEVEPIIKMARGVNAMHSAFFDAINLSNNPPIKVANNHTVRLDTLEYGPNALWLVGDNPNNVLEHRTGDQAINAYRTAIPSLKSAIALAMGESSQGLSSMDFRESEKTATEVMDTARQRQARDQQNQMYLTEALKDQMMLWVSNNRQFLFSDPSDGVKVIQIIGREMIDEFKELGLADNDLSQETAQYMQELILERGGDVSDTELNFLANETELPAYPVVMNPDEKKPENLEIKPKLEMSDDGASANLYIQPEDFADDLYFDYIPSVQSMSIGQADLEARGRMQALQLMLSGPATQMLAAQGHQIEIKELLTQVLEDLRVKDADKFFTKAQQPQQPMEAGGRVPGLGDNMAQVFGEGPGINNPGVEIPA